MATGDRRLLKAAFSGVWRFLAWWGAMFAFLAGFGTTCPFCGQPGCPCGPASAGVLGGLFATGVFLTRWLGKRLGRESCKPAGHASKLDFDSLAGRYDRWYDAPEGALYDRLEKPREPCTTVWRSGPLHAFSRGMAGARSFLMWAAARAIGPAFSANTASR